ncbi:V-type proton ATPase subunit E [Caloramator mitchellensis]|uniref:V-type proton ATPase subunit E n=1 Tax=Caloramator mitchellensis TaxID=908809 RepID=A0A0R3JR04_CALMK|nr:V-type ATP synthase subunit E [Caloramator mitchellensis]KRQ85899.1 V-type proton ATPase subunit E [Caloramator mitchellensis]
MVTIEEKIKLFTELIYQKIEKENQDEISKFNEEYSDILNQKRQEFEKYIDNLKEERIKSIKEEVEKVISKAKYEQKRMILKKKQEIFELFFRDLKESIYKFVATEGYRNWVLKSFDEASLKLFDGKFKITTNRNTYDILKGKLQQGKVEFELDEKMAGGFILEDSNRLRIDCSIENILEDNKERLGLILFKWL